MLARFMVQHRLMIFTFVNQLDLLKKHKTLHVIFSCCFIITLPQLSLQYWDQARKAWRKERRPSSTIPPMSLCLHCSLCLLFHTPCFPHESLSWPKLIAGLIGTRGWFQTPLCVLGHLSPSWQSGCCMYPARLSTVFTSISPGLCHCGGATVWKMNPYHSGKSVRKGMLLLQKASCTLVVFLLLSLSPQSPASSEHSLLTLPSHPWTYEPASQVTVLERLPIYTHINQTRSLLIDLWISNMDEDPHGQTQMQAVPTNRSTQEPWVNRSKKEMACLCSPPLGRLCQSVCSTALCLTWFKKKGFNKII